MRKVVITGMGVVSPVGSDLSTFWEAVSRGESGIRPVTKVDASRYPTKIAGEVKGFNAEQYIPLKEMRRMDGFCHYALGAADQAVKDSGLNLEAVDHNRMGVVIGSGVGGLKTLEEQHRNFLEKGPGRVSPFFIPMMIADMASGLVAIRYKARGPNYAAVSACASAAHALGECFKMIRDDEADVMIAGGSEAAVCDLGMSGFCSMKAMSTRAVEPAKASCPFDIKRDGFVMGEGAGILVIESEEYAKKRGARIYAELAGFGFSCDAYHMTAPAEGGEGAILSIKAAMRCAGLAPADVDYINAHGTSTELNDKNETAAIKVVFGDQARKLKISSTKSMIGHLLGASGAVELITTVLSIQNGIVTPTINYEDPDPACDLDYTPNKAVEYKVRAALSNSFGFGGHNATLAVKKYS